MRDKNDLNKHNVNSNNKTLIYSLKLSVIYI